MKEHEIRSQGFLTVAEPLVSPVAMFIFNRPDLTARVFSQIAAVRPRRLLIVADGPRDLHEKAACMETREVVEKVDWDCQVDRLYSDTNLGCGVRVSSGLDWVFSLVDEAIILEDDCYPHPTFFRYCSELLERYRDTPEVMCINGTNFQSGIRRTPFSYHFSRYCASWGWASWRRAWRHYDYNLEQWPEFRDAGAMTRLFSNRQEERYWTALLDKMSGDPGRIDTWDHQWNFACWKMNGFAIEPELNLVENLGFGREDSTHTHAENTLFGWLPVLDTEGLPELIHPARLDHCLAADAHIFEVVIRGSQRSRLGRLLDRIRKKLR